MTKEQLTAELGTAIAPRARMKCWRCGVEHDGRFKGCEACRWKTRQWARKYRLKHSERMRAYDARWRAANVPKIQAKRRRWYEKQRERLRFVRTQSAGERV